MALHTRPAKHWLARDAGTTSKERAGEHNNYPLYKCDGGKQIWCDPGRLTRSHLRAPNAGVHSSGTDPAAHSGVEAGSQQVALCHHAELQTSSLRIRIATPDPC